MSSSAPVGCTASGGSGGKGGNFVETMLRVAGQGKPLRVVADQRCAPTYTADLAAATVDLIGRSASGLFHVTSGGRHDVARVRGRNLPTGRHPGRPDADPECRVRRAGSPAGVQRPRGRPPDFRRRPPASPVARRPHGLSRRTKSTARRDRVTSRGRVDIVRQPLITPTGRIRATFRDRFAASTTSTTSSTFL